MGREGKGREGMGLRWDGCVPMRWAGDGMGMGWDIGWGWDGMGWEEKGWDGVKVGWMGWDGI